MSQIMGNLFAWQNLAENHTRPKPHGTPPSFWTWSFGVRQAPTCNSLPPCWRSTYLQCDYRLCLYLAMDDSGLWLWPMTMARVTVIQNPTFWFMHILYMQQGHAIDWQICIVLCTILYANTCMRACKFLPRLSKGWGSNRLTTFSCIRALYVICYYTPKSAFELKTQIWTWVEGGVVVRVARHFPGVGVNFYYFTFVHSI